MTYGAAMTDYRVLAEDAAHRAVTPDDADTPAERAVYAQAAQAYALLEVAAAIRAHTQKTTEARYDGI